MHRDDRSGSCRSLSPPFAKQSHYKGCRPIPEIYRFRSIISRCPVGSHVVRGRVSRQGCPGENHVYGCKFEILAQSNHQYATRTTQTYSGAILVPAVLLLALAAGGLTGIIAATSSTTRARKRSRGAGDLSSQHVTRVYADDGETVIGEFALEKRIPLKYEEIPQVLKNAILAVEDVRFYDHIGIDPIRIMGAAWKNITTDRIEGGSTLTQQLTKNLFLSKEQTYTQS